MRRKFWFLSIIFIFIASLEASGNYRQPTAIQRGALVLSNPSNLFEQGEILSPELIEAYNMIKSQEKNQPAVGLDAGQFNGKSGPQAVSVIADKYFQYWWSNSEARTTGFGKSVDIIENGMKEDVVVRYGNRQHHFHISVQTFETLAKLNYEGFLNASITYQALNSAVGWEVTEKVGQKDLVLTNKTTPLDNVSGVSLRWSW
jgi:hypothetical protein